MALVLHACVVDLDTLEVRGARPSTLTPQEAKLLGYLAGRAGEVVSRDQVLVDVWGYHPDSNTRAVDEAVRRLRSKIEADPRSPRALRTVRGVGWKLVLPQAAPATGHGFVGRQAELATLAESTGLVTLVGPPGIGKTRLARELASARQAWFVDLTAARTPEDVVSATFRALGKAEPPGELDARVERLAGALDGLADGLVVWDNFEQVMAAAPLVQRLLDGAPRLAALVTSRQRLGLPGERPFALDPLPAADAMALFRARAAAVVPGFDPQGDAERLLHDVVEALERMPLAIELAAARMNVFNLATLQRGLADRLSLLKADGLPARQASLRAALDWSWALLDADERDALSATAVFVGGFTLAALDAVLARPAADVLGRLVDKSLVRRLPPPEPTDPLRFDLFVAVREYVTSEAPPAAADHARHAAYYAAFGRDGLLEAPRDSEGPAHMRQLRADLGNARAAVDWAISVDDALQAAEACATALAVITRVGPVPAGLDMVARALDLPSADPPVACRLEAWRALLWLYAAIDARAVPAAEAALRLAPGDLYEPRVMASTVLGIVARKHGDLDAAQRYWQNALGVARVWGRAISEADALSNLANLHVDRGDHDSAVANLERALEMYRQAGNRRGEASSLGWLGYVYRVRGNVREAAGRYRQARELCAAVDDRRTEVAMVMGLAAVARNAGRLTDAIEYAEAGLALSRDVGVKLCVSHLELAEAWLELGDLAAAHRYGREAADEGRALGWDEVEGLALAILAEVAAADGDHTEAAALLTRARPLAAEVGRPEDRAHFACRAGMVAVLAGDHDAGAAHLARAEALVAGRGWGERSDVGHLVERLRTALG